MGEYHFARFPQIQQIYERARKMGIDLEKRTYENVILFYSEELKAIHEGKISVEYLPSLVVKKMRKLGVIDSSRTNKAIVVPKALEIIEGGVGQIV